MAGAIGQGVAICGDGTFQVVLDPEPYGRDPGRKR